MTTFLSSQIIKKMKFQSEYVRLARYWPGYGSYLFKVENNESQFGNSILTLSVAASGVSVYKRGHPTVLENYTYKK